MPNFRPGSSGKCLIDRCLKPHLADIARHLGDPVSIDGVSVDVRWNAQNDKDDGGLVLAPNDSIQVCWPCNAGINPCAGSELIRKGKRYTLRNDPDDLHNGWICANLKYCGTC